MIERINRKIRRTLSSKDSGYIIQDKALLNAYEINQNFPRLISFPRTGSHWLRMLMELYFSKPSLVYVFYEKDPIDFTCIHKHDIKLDLPYVDNLIYLFRNPLDTMYSFSKYHKKDIDDMKFVEASTELYAKHIEKWVINNQSYDQRCVLTYESLKNEPNDSFKRICEHLNTEFDRIKFEEIYSNVNKDKVSKRTKHSNQILNNSKGYDDIRLLFRQRYESLIMKKFHSVNNKLSNYY